MNERAVRLLDFPITPVVQRTVDRAWLTYRMSGGFVRSFHQPFTYMTMRERLDSYLAQRAVSVGAEVMDGARVVGVEAGDGPVRISVAGETIEGRVLVGADGVNSVVAHQAGLLRDAEVGVGLESEVYPAPGILEPWKDTAGLDFGTLRGGYMWVFPKEDHLSIGVAGFARWGPRMRGLLDAYLGFLGLEDAERRLTRGHRLARRKRGMAIQSGPVLLVGDAAGLMDFWTGEGIYYAVKSAQAAVPAIAAYLEGATPDFADYEKTIDAELMPELQIARTLTRIAVWFPKLTYTLMKRSDWVWNAGCQVLRSEKTYHDVRGRMGPLTFLFDLAGKGT